jgi:hypothetical protein
MQQDTSPQGLIKTANLIQNINPAKAAEFRGAAAALEQQAAQQRAAQQRAASVMASSQDMLRAEGKAELADRLPDLFAENPMKAREFAIEQLKTPPLSSDVRSRKIQDLTEIIMRTQGLEELEAATKATNITDGVIDLNYLEDGSVVELNKATGTARRVPFDPTVPTAAQPSPAEGQDNPYELPEGMSLLEAVENGTGFVNIIPETVGRILSNIAPSAVAEDKTKAMNVLRAADNSLIRAFSLNPRYPVAEQQRIRENYGIAPSMTDSPKAARLRVYQLDSFIEKEIATAQGRINDPATPPEQINADKTLISNLNAFRNTLIPAQVEATQLRTAKDVKALSPSRLDLLIKNTTEEELNLLPQEVLTAIEEAL